MDILINIQLTNSEWYFIGNLLQRTSREFSDNYIVTNLLQKFIANKPQMKNFSDEFLREYEVAWKDKTK